MLARRLHVDDGMGASAIVQRTGLDKNLIRQQLFDALLLPPALRAEAEEPTPERPLRPDPSQDRAVKHRGSPFQLQAGPGTGKTRTLVKTVLSLLDEGVQPGSILILTFSNRAAGELSERIFSEHLPRQRASGSERFTRSGLIWFAATMSGWDCRRSQRLFDRSDAIAVLEEILPTLPLIHYRNLWDRH